MALNVNELTAAIEAGFDREWAAAKGTPAPSAGTADRRIMFAAVARGILQYLEAQENELINTMSGKDEHGNGVFIRVETTDLDIDTN